MTTYLRKTKGFTKVSSRACMAEMSVGAIGLLTLILSNLDSFVIYKGNLQKRAKVGKKLFAKYWKELESNGFVYEIVTNKGRINYEYIIVNDPTNESSIEAINQMLENREPFLIDGEVDAENHLLDIVDGEEGPNIYLNKQELNNEDLNNKEVNNKELNNEDLSNSTLAISKTHSDVEELKNYWYENIHTTKLSESEEKEILTQKLFVSTLNDTVSLFIQNKTLCEKIKLKYSLKSFYYVFNMTVRDWKYTNKPFTGIDITEEVISFIQR